MGGVVGLAENKATQPSLIGVWTELGDIVVLFVVVLVVVDYVVCN